MNRILRCTLGLVAALGLNAALADDAPLFEFDTNRYGGDYRHFPSTKYDSAECFEACRADNRCAAWSYVRSGYPGAGCYLKGSQPAKSSNPCCISGTFARIVDRVPPPPGTPPPVTPPSTVSAAACPYGFDGYRNRGTDLVCNCTSEAATYNGRLYGVDSYTDDSHICKAARHAGVIGAQGGTVRVRPLPGQRSYPALSRNGVSSGAWGEWPASFRVESP